MSLVTVHKPAELEALGFEAPVLDTLELTPLYAVWQKTFEGLIRQLPGLRTPRVGLEGGTPPKPHQLRHAGIGLQRRHNFYSWGMGAGKTCCAALHVLGRYGHLLFAGLKGRSIEEVADKFDKTFEEVEGALARKCSLRPGVVQIVAPRHTLEQVWVKELSRMNLGAFVEVIRSEEQMLQSTAPIWVYHFDFPKEQSKRGILQRKAKEGLRLKPKGGTYFLGHPVAKVLARRFRAGLLIVDEIHRLRPGTARTEAMRIVRRKAKHVIGLTGTPMDGWVSQAANILGFIYGPDSRSYPYTDEDFAKRFTRTRIANTDFATGKETVGREKPMPGIAHMQIPAFVKATRPLMHRLNLTDPEIKANVVYPPVQRHKVLVTMGPAQAMLYREWHRTRLEALQEALEQGRGFQTRNNVLTLLNELRLGSSAPWELGYLEPTTALIDNAIAIVRQHQAEGRKGLIGTTFVKESRYIHEALARAGFKGVRLYATDDGLAKKTLKPDDREALIEQFVDEPDCAYLIATKELVAEGLNLAETASYSISCSHGWRSNIEDQWRARIERPGQVWPHVDAYTLLNDETVDLYIYQMLMAKSAASSGLIDLDFSAEGDHLAGAIDPYELAERLSSSSPLAAEAA